jgi:hypothetical protein
MSNFQAAKLYSLPQNFVVVDEFRIEGFSEDEAVSYETESDAVEHLVSADGEVTVSTTNDERMVVTITVMETSESCRRLDGLRRRQRDEMKQGRLETVGYSHSDRINGDLVRGEGIFLSYGKPSKGKGAGTREFQILLPYSAAKTNLAPNIGL